MHWSASNFEQMSLFIDNADPPGPTILSLNNLKLLSSRVRRNEIVK